jgi:hypothetical protein
MGICQYQAVSDKISPLWRQDLLHECENNLNLNSGTILNF